MAYYIVGKLIFFFHFIIAWDIVSHNISLDAIMKILFEQNGNHDVNRACVTWLK